MKDQILTLFVLLMMFSCSTPKTENEAEDVSMRTKSILGKWTNVSMQVGMKIEGQEDSVLLAKEGEWEHVLKIKPVLTTYKEDSSFNSEYFTLDGQKFNTIYGKWWLRNDSLVMLTEYGETAYHYEFSNNRVRFRSKMDWNIDGTLDDYDGIQVKVE